MQPSMPAPTTRPGLASAAPARVLSGIQPSGRPHLGNFFGAIQQHLELQHEHPGEAFYFLASYHALTTVQNGAELRALTRDAALDYLALGLDPQKASFFDQADVPEVCELAWILGTVTGMGLMEKAVSYKDKIAKGITPSVGLFTYPVLQAADILIYRSTLVPVGEDQVQHIEFTRDIAGYFNTTYGAGEELLPLPTYRLSAGKRVPGIDGQKMSKSYGNSIGIFDEGKELSKKVMGIKTASVPLGQPLDPDSDTVFALYRLVASPEEVADMERRYREGQVGYGQAKKELLAKIDALFAPARERRRELEKDPEVVNRVLTEGALRARSEARRTIDVCRRACGLGR
jgi:tryptophanyl-tRNA synthetase